MQNNEMSQEEHNDFSKALRSSESLAYESGDEDVCYDDSKGQKIIDKSAATGQIAVSWNPEDEEFRIDFSNEEFFILLGKAEIIALRDYLISLSL